MKVEIYWDGQLVGRSALRAEDPPMGVAGGTFEPTEAYDPELHSADVEGVENPSVDGRLFVVRSPDHGFVDCAGVLIQDFSEGLGERRLAVLGISNPEYETWFGEDPSFKDYWRKT